MLSVDSVLPQFFKERKGKCTQQPIRETVYPQRQEGTGLTCVETEGRNPGAKSVVRERHSPKRSHLWCGRGESSRAVWRTELQTSVAVCPVPLEMNCLYQYSLGMVSFEGWAHREDLQAFELLLTFSFNWGKSLV